MRSPVAALGLIASVALSIVAFPTPARAYDPACDVLVELEQAVVSPGSGTNVKAFALLRNPSPCWMHEAVVVWHFYDDAGEEVDFGSAQRPFPSLVPPGGRFGAYWSGSVEEYASWDVSVGYVGQADERPSFPLSVGDVTATPRPDDTTGVEFSIDNGGECWFADLETLVLGLDGSGDLVSGAFGQAMNDCDGVESWGEMPRPSADGIHRWIVFVREHVNVNSRWTSWNGYFGDLRNSPFMDDVAWIANERLTGGCGTNRYCPTQSVTRGQMASFLARGLSLPPASTDYFSDDNSSIHEADINRLRAAGIGFGCGADRFCPAQKVTRAQMASFLVRALDLPPTSTDYFTDDESSIHETDINRVRAAGITSGCAAGRYCPSNNVTRGQMAAFLRRAFE
ncbi:MAG TPA: S-layer homology domain-containing protein [Candidatus Limnocylindria bacterium]|nr:S-layer homology domain-containing protein [Candidatus Limnocylindria bacterium]